MSGLVAYGSSDEEDTAEQVPQPIEILKVSALCILGLVFQVNN
jgi:hypothetical protein